MGAGGCHSAGLRRGGDGAKATTSGLRRGLVIHGTSLSERRLLPEQNDLDKADRGIGYPAKLWRPKGDLIRKARECGVIRTQRGTPVIQAYLEVNGDLGDH